MNKNRATAENGIRTSIAAEEHGDVAALRGVPSLVWRAGQARRLEMILQWGSNQDVQSNEKLMTDPIFATVLDNGCGIGMYIKALQPYSEMLFGNELEAEHLYSAAAVVPEAHLQIAVCEHLPYPDNFFDLILSHEVLEHVHNDRAAACEIVRALKPGGRAVIFVPNRWHPFETHGHYWRGEYHFGNTPLINYLPNLLRDRLAPHVRAYSSRGLRRLFTDQPIRIVHHTQIYPGYDNIVHRKPTLGRQLRKITYMLEKSPLAIFGNSHLFIIEKQ